MYVCVYELMLNVVCINGTDSNVAWVGHCFPEAISKKRSWAICAHINYKALLSAAFCTTASRYSELCQEIRRTLSSAGWSRIFTQQITFFCCQEVFPILVSLSEFMAFQPDITVHRLIFLFRIALNLKIAATA